MLRGPNLARGTIRKHVRKRRGAAIGKNAADCRSTGVAVIRFQLVEQYKHPDFARVICEPLAKPLADDGLSIADISLPGQHTIQIDFAAAADHIVTARQTHGMSLRKPERLEHFLVLERTSKIMGSARLNQCIEMIDIGSRNQDKKRCRVDFHCIRKRSYGSQSFIERTARIDQCDHRTAGNEALFSVISPSRRNCLPACQGHGCGEFITVPE